MRTLAVLLTALLVTGCKTAPPPSPAAAPGRPGARTERSFHFEYGATVKGIPAGAKKVRIWVPLPRSDAAQEISNLEVKTPVPYAETEELLHGNRMAYLEVDGEGAEGIPIQVSFDVHRREVTSIPPPARAAVLPRLLEGDRLAPLGGEVAARAAQATAGRGDSQEKARGIYDRVLADVAYDKTGTGWGKGDIAHVCAVGKGNCSDFHALFIGMARAQRIPALFEIGFPLPPDKVEGTIGGYHCWAWYEEKPGVWRPVDASEADKDPSRKEYFFGTLCCNRVGLTRGRDLVLEPRQAGEPVNFLIYPYVEVDGKPDAATVEKTFSFRDLGL